MNQQMISDPGVQAETNGLSRRAVAVSLAIIGVLLTSIIFGVVVDGIREKMDNLKKGKSGIYEVGHTLLLGWNAKVR